MNNLFRKTPFSRGDEMHEHPSAIVIDRKENKGKSCLLFSLVFAGFRKELSAEKLPF